MSILVAIPAYRITCKVGIDKVRPWSVIDEAFLWAAHQAPTTIAELSARSDLPPQLVVASLARMMRFRLIEAVVDRDGQPGFRTSAYGQSIVTSGLTLPQFPKHLTRNLGITIERATGFIWFNWEARPWSLARLEAEKAGGVEVRMLTIDGAPPLSHETTIPRIQQMVERAQDEHLAFINGPTTSVRDDEFLVVRVVDGVLRGLPASATPALRDIITKAAEGDSPTGPLAVPYSGKSDEPDDSPVRCQFDAQDLIVGGPAHRECLLEALRTCERRLIIHSTFLRVESFELLAQEFRDAAERGVKIDILWGATSKGKDGDREVSATHISERILADPVMRTQINVDMRSTGSHSKALLYDDENGNWIGVLGSCNWLSSPLRAIEVSVRLRAPVAAAKVARVVQRLVSNGTGLSHPIANELALVSAGVFEPGDSGNASITLLTGDAHNAQLRVASGKARRRLVIGSHRLGATARTGALLPGLVAAKGGARVQVFYTKPSHPLRNRDARALAAEAASNDVTLTHAKIPVHGKFVAWDEDDVLVTSLNWASAATDDDNPLAEVGLHVHAPGIATALLDQIGTLLPQLTSE